MTVIGASLGEIWISIAIHLWQTTWVVLAILLIASSMRAAPARLLHLLWSLAFLKVLLPGALFGWSVRGVTPDLAARLSSLPVLGPVGAILLHEDGHRRRRDPLHRAFQQLCVLLLFFYPPLGLVRRRLQQAASLLSPLQMADGKDTILSADAPATSEEKPLCDPAPQILPETLVRPVYPKEEARDGVEGRVLLYVEVLDDGMPGAIEAKEEVEDHPAFTEAAITAVRQWRFEPGEADGEPAVCEVSIPIVFRLE